MVEKFRAPRGVEDILPDEQPYWRFVRDTARRVAESYGYREIQTPVFEYSGVWLRPGAQGAITEPCPTGPCYANGWTGP